MNDNSIVREFRAYLRHFERELNFQNNSSCCCGVTISQCHTLMELDKHRKMTVNDLSEKLYLDKSTVSRTVDGLVKVGLVDRTIPDNDRRTTLLSLTEQGVSVCSTINQGNDDYYLKALNAVPDENRKLFLESFKTMVEAMMDLNKSFENE